MLNKRSVTRVSLVAALIGVFGLASPASARQPQDATLSKGTYKVLVRAKEEKRWIGLACVSVPDALRAHIDLDEDQGLLVKGVVAPSPADKAGLAVFDILLEANGKPLKSLDDLVEAVAEAGDDEIQLKWLHRGDELTKVLRPVTRPESVDSLDSSLLPQDAFPKGFRWRNGDFTAPFQMRVFGPSFEVEGHTEKDYPKDLKIQVRKEGSEPAQIVVEKGDQRWEITVDELDKLPKRLRPLIERFTGGGFHIRVPQVPEIKKEIEVFQRPETRRFFRQFAPFDMQKRLEIIDRRMDQLHEELRKLRGGEDADPEEDMDAESKDEETDDVDSVDEAPETSV